MFIKLLIFFVLLYVFIKFIYKREKKRFIGQNQKTNSSDNNVDITKLYSCPVCETYFQKTQGFKLHGKYYCSERCAKKET